MNCIFRFVFLGVLMASLPSMNLLAQQLDKEVLGQLKSATAFIKTGRVRGSGFLIHKDGNKGYFATNHHVIITPSGKTASSVTLILNSGSEKERSLKAKVMGVDRKNDLAIIEVKDKNLPEPISLHELPQVTETLEVFAIGFPFGEALGLNDRNPSLTISKGTVSSIRKSEDQKIAAIQLDADLNPGNSGGPIVTSDGKLVGVAVATLFATQISWAIPADQLLQLRKGYVTQVNILLEPRGKKGDVALVVKSEFMDPLRSIQNPQFTIHEIEDTSDFPERVDHVVKSEALENPVHQANLKEGKENNMRIGECVVKSSGRKVVTYAVQISYTDASGEHIHLRPIKKRIEFDKLKEDGVDSVVLEVEGLKEKSEVTMGVGAYHIQLEEIGTDFALNPDTGDLVVLDAVNGTVRRYSSAYLDGDDVELEEPLELYNHPISICYKTYQDKSYYVVAVYDDRDLYLIDAKDFKIEKRIQLFDTNVTRVECSQDPQDPNIYYLSGVWSEKSVGRVSLKTMKDEGRSFNEVLSFAVSADGKFIYRKDSSSPSGFECLQRFGSRDNPVYQQIFSQHRTTPDYVPGPRGNFTAAGNRIFSSDLHHEIGQVDFDVKSFSKERPLIAGINLKEGFISVASSNSYKSFGKAPLPKEFIKSLENPKMVPEEHRRKMDKRRLRYRMRMFTDDASSRLIVANEQNLLIFSLSTFGVKEEPFMSVTMESPEKILVKEKAKIKLTVEDEKVEFELINPPKGFLKKKDHYEWTPELDKVGTYALNVSLRFNELRKTQMVHLKVEHPSLHLPYPVERFYEDRETGRIITWTSTSGKLVLIDGVKQSVIASRDLKLDIHEAKIDQHYVYIRPQNGGYFRVLNVNDLSDHKRIFTSNPRYQLYPTPNELIISEQSNAIYSLSLPELEPAGKRWGWETRSGRYSDAVRRLDTDRWWINGVIFDKTLKTVRLLENPTYPSVLVLPLNPKSPGMGRRYSEEPKGIWQRSIKFNRTLSKQDNVNIAQLGDAKGSLILNKIPLAVTINQQYQNNRSGSNSWTGILATFELISGRKLEKFPVYNINYQPKYGDKYQPIIGFLDDKLLCSYQDRMYFVSTDHLDKPPPMLQLEQRQDHILLPSEDEVTLKHYPKGGKTPLTFSMLHQDRNMNIDPKTGIVTLNVKKIRTIAEDAVLKNIHKDRRQKTIEDARNVFQQITGNSVKGFPVALPIHVEVKDEENQSSQIDYHVFLEVNPKVPKPTPRPQPTPIVTVYNPGTKVNTHSNTAAHEVRIQALEKKISELEAKIDLLVKLLQQK